MITHGGRLPAQTSRFFGRSQEGAGIREALKRSRLVTLTGPGGVGKTRLALRVAEELTEAFPDGVRLAQLSSARDADDVLLAVAAALGLPAEAAAIAGEYAASVASAGEHAASAAFAEQADRLANGLSGRRLLLILDTCEHLVDACAAFADAVLSGADGPVILVTSRQPLDLPGEVVFRIPPFTVPPGSPGLDSPGLDSPGPLREAADDGDDAVALFADRAGAALPGFVVTDEARPKVIWLCRALDGIPLEIELAALRLRAVGLDELLARLPGRLRLLAGGRRADDRQQTVQASITWSYDLCTPAERLLWNRLSVFSGGFGLTAVEEVCGGGDLAVGDVLETLIGLVDKSVVLRADFAGGDARYRLLEVVREQGAAHAGPADAAERAARHRDHYLGVARRFAAGFVGPDQVRLVSRLAQDAANLRLALEDFLAVGEHDPEQLARGTELAIACLPWWACTGQFAQASLWFARFSAESSDHHPERSRDSTPPATAARAWSPTPAVFRRLTGWLLAAEGEATAAATRLAGLLAGLDAALELLARGAFAECTAGCAALMAGLPAGECWVRGWAAWITGVASLLGGDAEAAGQWLRDGLGLVAPFGDDLTVAQYLEAFAWLAAARGEHRRTAWLHGAADRRWQRLLEHGSRGMPRVSVALLQAERDRAERTARDALGPEGYASAHGAGTALSARDALRCAFGELPAQPPLAAVRLSGPGWSAAEAGHQAGASHQAGAGQAGAVDHAGRWQHLTTREREVAVLVAKGMTNKDIAARLFVSKRTVDAHIEHILAKLSYASRVQIAALVAHEQAREAEAEAGQEPPCPVPVPRAPREHISAPPGAADLSIE